MVCKLFVSLGFKVLAMVTDAADSLWNMLLPSEENVVVHTKLILKSKNIFHIWGAKNYSSNR